MSGEEGCVDGEKDGSECEWIVCGGVVVWWCGMDGRDRDTVALLVQRPTQPNLGSRPNPRLPLPSSPHMPPKSDNIAWSSGMIHTILYPTSFTELGTMSTLVPRCRQTTGCSWLPPRIASAVHEQPICEPTCTSCTSAYISRLQMLRQANTARAVGSACPLAAWGPPSCPARVPVQVAAHGAMHGSCLFSTQTPHGLGQRVAAHRRAAPGLGAGGGGCGAPLFQRLGNVYASAIPRAGSLCSRAMFCVIVHVCLDPWIDWILVPHPFQKEDEENNLYATRHGASTRF